MFHVLSGTFSNWCYCWCWWANEHKSCLPPASGTLPNFSPLEILLNTLFIIGAISFLWYFILLRTVWQFCSKTNVARGIWRLYALRLKRVKGKGINFWKIKAVVSKSRWIGWSTQNPLRSVAQHYKVADFLLRNIWIY